MPNLNLTPQSLLVLGVGQNLLKNRRQLERMVGLVEDRRISMAANIIIADNGCWLWSGSLNHHGYGKIGIQWESYRVHRIIWMLVHGWIPRRVKVCHDCDAPPCCNPAHLFAGTQLDNLKDMRAKGRHSRGEKVAQHVLTENKVRELRVRRARGESVLALVPISGIGIRALYRVLSGERWRHVV